jgi:hypothetical protein
VATHQKQQQPQQKKQQPAPGSAAAAFQAAFGSVLAGAPAVDEAEAARLKALADAQKDQDLDKLLAHYEKKDAVAQQLEGITKMEVWPGGGREVGKGGPAVVGGASRVVPPFATSDVSNGSKAVQTTQPRQVTAFRCKACGTLGEKRRPECSSHDVERLKVGRGAAPCVALGSVLGWGPATDEFHCPQNCVRSQSEPPLPPPQAAKRWFKCRACGWRVTTLNAPVPTRRCPHCRDPAAEYDRTTPFVAPRGDKAGDAALFAGFASREGMLARGVEHDFSLSSFH